MRKLLVLILALAISAALTVPALGAATKNVQVSNMLKFVPKKLKIKKGTKVVWTWDGGVLHNVTVIKGPVKFHSKDKSSGTYSHVFKKKGTYKLECTIHQFFMTVKVT